MSARTRTNVVPFRQSPSAERRLFKRRLEQTPAMPGLRVRRGTIEEATLRAIEAGELPARAPLRDLVSVDLDFAGDTVEEHFRDRDAD